MCIANLINNYIVDNLQELVAIEEIYLEKYCLGFDAFAIASFPSSYTLSAFINPLPVLLIVPFQILLGLPFHNCSYISDILHMPIISD